MTSHTIALDYLSRNRSIDGDRLILAHGYLKINGTFVPHAWVEAGGRVIDLSISEAYSFDKHKYYYEHEVRISARYSEDEALRLHKEKGHDGPWK